MLFNYNCRNADKKLCKGFVCTSLLTKDCFFDLAKLIDLGLAN